MKHIKIEDWSEFEGRLRQELDIIRHDGDVTARSFQLVSFDKHGNEVDRLEIVRSTGTDRDSSSPLWNEPGFDYEHDLAPIGKEPDEVIYAFTLDMSRTPYLVRHSQTPEALDITESLSEHDGIIVYDSRQLKRVSKNEYWFCSSPMEAALMVVTVEVVD